MALKNSRGELQLWFRTHSNRRLEPGDMSSQSLGTPTRDNFETPLQESREKKPFGCSLHRKLQRILCGGRWWFPPSSGHGESSESKCSWLVPTPKGVPECELTLLWLVLDAESNPETFSTPLYPLLVLEVGSSPQVSTFCNSTYLDLQMGLARDLGACQLT